MADFLKIIFQKYFKKWMPQLVAGRKVQNKFWHPVSGILLIGEYKHTIDDKKRLAIPAKLRKEIGKGAVLTRGLDNSLALYPAKEWQKMVEKLRQLPSGKSDARGFNRLILAGAAAADLDGLGRVLIPDYLKEYASLKKNAVVVGVHDRLEIWDEDKWESYKKRVEGEVGNMAERLGELGV